LWACEENAIVELASRKARISEWIRWVAVTVIRSA
jgi:hypothetical protein